MTQSPHCRQPEVELVDRGHNARPRYVVYGSEPSVAGGCECFVAAMEFATRVARALDCAVVVRRTEAVDQDSAGRNPQTTPSLFAPKPSSI